MTDYRVSCTTKTTAANGTHGHITGVGLAGVSGVSSVSAVYSWMDSGHRFFTMSPSTGKYAMVHKAVCCGVHTLRTGADAVTDNNLDNLPRC